MEMKHNWTELRKKASPAGGAMAQHERLRRNRKWEGGHEEERKQRQRYRVEQVLVIVVYSLYELL